MPPTRAEHVATVGQLALAPAQRAGADGPAIRIEGHALPSAFCTQNTYEPINVRGNRISKSFQLSRLVRGTSPGKHSLYLRTSWGSSRNPMKRRSSSLSMALIWAAQD